MSKRRVAREMALQLLYRIGIEQPRDIDAVVNVFWEENPQDSEIELFASILVKQVVDHLSTIDELINAAAVNWDIKRIARIELNLLRMAVAEMLYVPDIPPKVSLNEAIELSKLYGSSGKSYQFVNGILDYILHNQGIEV